MKKIFSSLVIAVFAVALMAGGAWAASIKPYASQDTDDGARTFKIANEAYSTTAGVAVADKAQLLVVKNAVVGPVKVGIGISNASLDSASAGESYVLAEWEDNGNGQIDAGELFIVVDNVGNVPIIGNVVAGKLTFSAVTVMKSDADGGAGAEKDITAGSSLVVCSVKAADSAAQKAAAIQGTDMTTAPVSNTSGRVSFNFSVNSGLSMTDKVGLSYYENASTTADATCDYAVFMNEYVAGVATPADAVIDVTNARTKFTPASQVDTVVVKIADRDTVNTTAAPYNDTIDYSGSTYFLATVGANAGSVDNIVPRLYGTNQTALTGTGGSVADDGGALTYDAAGYWEATAGVDVDVTAGGTTVITYTLTTDATDVINTDTFTVSLLSDPLNANFNTITYLSSGTEAGEWSINGAQFVIPHMISRDGWKSFLVVKTAKAAPASEIFIDMLNRNGDAASLTKAELPKLDVEAGKDGGSVLITAADLLGAAGWPINDMDQDFSATLTFTIPQEQVYVEGLKYAEGSTYSMSVYEKKTATVGGTTISKFIK